MIKRVSIIFLAYSLNAIADVPVTSTADSALTYKMSSVYKDAVINLKTLVDAVSKAQRVEDQITALKNLNDFSADPINATSKVNSVVGNMLNDFNMRSGTSFGNLQDLISGLASSTTATGMSLQLQQSSATQLQNISVMLQQMEAENQAILRYKQAEEALKTQQDATLQAQQKKTHDNLVAKTQNINDAFHKE
jgi:hypothetical protein